MTNNSEWNGYESYEAYINRGLTGIFNTDKVIVDSCKTSKPVTLNEPSSKAKPRKRYKPKNVYDIVASYSHHEGDKQWLADSLLRFPLAKREPVMLRYSQVYNSAHSAAGGDNTQIGQARRTANTWLVEFIDKQQ